MFKKRTKKTKDNVQKDRKGQQRENSGRNSRKARVEFG